MTAATLTARDPHTLFTGVDRALFISTFSAKLRAAGLATPLSAVSRAAAAIEAVGPLTLAELYWACRVALVSERADIELFDRVFEAVFETTDNTRGTSQRNFGGLSTTGDAEHRVKAQPNTPDEVSAGSGLPWATRPSVLDTAEEDVDDEVDDADDVMIPELMPSAEEMLVERPFDELDERELATVAAELEAAMTEWPMRPSRRRRRAHGGDRTELRSTLRHSMRSGGEPLTLITSRRRHRPRRVVVLVDVSGSMESFARAYLHVTRALVLAGQAEVFAFATELTRITTSLKHRSPTEAIEQASDAVGDRFGGTRLASSVRSLLAHQRWGGLVRGAVVVIVSDGWDSDAPDETERSMARLARRSHRVVWINPRAAANEFEPKVAAMAAALPHCDHFLPGHSRRAIDDVIAAIAKP